MSQPVTAIFDIGKTNKKFLLFDDSFQIVYEQEEVMAERCDEDGFACEDLPGLELWMQQTLDTALHNPEFTITALNFATYGASFVHIDGQGQPITPLYNYQKPYPTSLLDGFYEQYGSRDALAVRTASPAMGMLNSGLQLYWLKHQQPSVFDRTAASVHFPQYCSYLFTRRLLSDVTSIGCHTMLWDFTKNDYCRWVYAENIHEKLPTLTIHSPYSSSSVRLNGHDCRVGIGVHDSSSALIPYLLAFDEPFVLVSTGTWSIALNPFNRDPLTVDELAQDCLSCLNFRGMPVKAARIFLGREHEYQTERLAAHFDKPADYYRFLQPDGPLLRQLEQQPDPARKLIPAMMHGTGPFPAKETTLWDLSAFDSYEAAYHQLMVDLVAMQTVSLRLAMGQQRVKTIFIDGGFGHNAFFTSLLAQQFPDIRVCTAQTKQATALGAVLLMHAAESNVQEKIRSLFEFQYHESLAY